MQQVIQPVDGRTTEVVDVPVPACQRHQVLIANACSLISVGTEKTMVELARRSLLAKARERPDHVRRLLQKVRQEGVVDTLRQVRARLDRPIPLGYSSAGLVLEVGPGVAAFRPGDRVASNGPHAAVVAVGQNMVARIPASVPFDQACYAVVGSIALQGVRLAQVGLGAVVGVVGLGLIGQLAVTLLRASGCTVVGSDPDAARCALARALGADWAEPVGLADAVAARTGSHGADAVLIAASTKSNGPLEQAARVARQKARVVAIGAVGMDVPRREFYSKELELVVSCSYGPGRYDPSYEEAALDYPYAYVRWTEQRNIQAMLDLMGTGRLDVLRLTTHRFPIERAVAAYEMIRGGTEEALGVVLTYPEPPAGSPSRRIALAGSAAKGPARKPTGATLGVGFVGAGQFASAVLLPALASQAGVVLRGLCSAGGLSAWTQARRHGFGYACSDYREVLDDPEIDVVFVATRHHQHAAMLLEALRMGKHAFVEKPLALLRDELEEIESSLAGAEGAGPCWTVGFNRRFSPAAVAVREHFRVVEEPITAVYRFNAGDLPPDHWAQNPEVGGGRIVGEACHAVDLLTFLLDSPPVHVYAEAVAPRSGQRGANDRCALVFRHANGGVSTLLYTAGGDCSFAKERVELFAAGRVGVIDDFRRVELYRGDRHRTHTWRGQAKGHREEVAAFLDAVRSGRPGPIPTADLLATSRATIAALESIQTGRPIDF